MNYVVNYSAVMAWIPIGAWIAAVVVALVVLGYCAYELSWKLKRLRRDVASLDYATAGLKQLQGEFTRAQQRAAELKAR